MLGLPLSGEHRAARAAFLDSWETSIALAGVNIALGTDTYPRDAADPARRCATPPTSARWPAAISKAATAARRCSRRRRWAAPYTVGFATTSSRLTPRRERRTSSSSTSPRRRYAAVRAGARSDQEPHRLRDRQRRCTPRSSTAWCGWRTARITTGIDFAPLRAQAQAAGERVWSGGWQELGPARPHGRRDESPYSFARAPTSA